MGWFSFGKKSKKQAEELEKAKEQGEKLENVEQSAQAGELAEQHSVVEQSAGQQYIDQLNATSYEGRGEQYGPWDVDDEAVPDYDSYLALGSMYLPYLPGIELRIKANRGTGEIMGATITYGKSSLELEAYAAPKTRGQWAEIRADLLNGNANASETHGRFGAEVLLPVALNNGKTLTTRIVGVDGPRWMLRGIFTGPAANQDSEERAALEQFFADIVVERGEEPLAPRDLIPMHQPVPPSQRKAAQEAANDQGAEDLAGKLDKPEGPFDSDQQTEVQTTLSRGPMFSEMR